MGTKSHLKTPLIISVLTLLYTLIAFLIDRFLPIENEMLAVINIINSIVIIVSVVYMLSLTVTISLKFLVSIYSKTK